ncbi:MAG: DUF2061 domain-containing protein [Alphaproteobacteria bacterium]|nr:MAG: DUF2061 domain-containing protein [Alphaproteobacteria bacterium]
MKVSYSLMKTGTYALMHMTVAIGIAFALSGSWKTALAIGLIEPLVQTFCFFFHERAWHKVETRARVRDHHDEVINSTTPVGNWLEKLVRRRK